MNLILGFLTSRLGASVVSVLLILALGFSVTQTLKLNTANHNLRAETARADAGETRLGLCHTNIATLNMSIANQNAHIAALGAEGARRTAEASRALDEALKSRAGAEARAARLLNTPSVGIDACARAVEAREAVLGLLK